LPDEPLRGKVAVVTGASRGIGATIAQRFAQAGAAVAVSARTEQQSDTQLPGTIHETVAAITGLGGTALAIRSDISKPEDRHLLVETAQHELGPVDILVNNAAVTYFLPVEEFPEKRFRLMFEVQVRAPFELVQLVLPTMRERGQGWILNISSGAARHPEGPPFSPRGRGATVYGMCKAAVERLSTGLAAEVYESGIAVNALSPTRVVPTPGVLFHQLIPPDADIEAVSEPAEVIAEAALKLCSGDPKTLTGRIAYSQQIVEEFGLKPTPVESVAE
jgi:citronellol/citronellal dehydrogenase